MSADSPTRSTLRLRGLALLLCATCGCFGGCVIVKPMVSNPTSNIVRVAVVPFVNHSAEPAVDPVRFSNAYFAELQKVPGFEVVPVSVTARAIELLRLPMSGPDDALALARELDVDAVVLGAVTDYDPYYPPRIGLHVEWYSPHPPDFRPGVPVDPYLRPEWWRERHPRGPGPHLHDSEPLRVPDPFSSRGPFGSGHPIAIPPAGEPCDGVALPRGTSSQLPLSRRPGPFVVRGQSPVVRSNPGRAMILPTSEVAPRPRRTSNELIRPLPRTSAAERPARLPGPGFRVDTFPNPFAPEATWNDDLNPDEDLTLAVQPAGTTEGEAVPIPVLAPPPDDLVPLPREPVGEEAGDPVEELPPPERLRPLPPESFVPWPGPDGGTGLGSPFDSPYAPAPPPVAGSVADAPPMCRPPAPLIAFDPRQPVMSYTRIFDGRNADLLARLRDYYTLSGDQRSGGWEAYLHRSDDFIRFTAHVMISEMLTLHGGETKRRYVLKLRKRH